MPIEPVPFVHYIVDLSLRDITTSTGETITICQIEANAPLDCEIREEKEWYIWGRVIEAGKPFEFECGPFCFILVPQCCGDMGVFAIAHVIPDEPTFQALVYEGDDLIVAKCSDVSIGSKASFDFAWFSAGQRLRIETIPDLATHHQFREILWAKEN